MAAPASEPRATSVVGAIMSEFGLKDKAKDEDEMGTWRGVFDHGRRVGGGLRRAPVGPLPHGIRTGTQLTARPLGCRAGAGRGRRGQPRCNCLAGAHPFPL